MSERGLRGGHEAAPADPLSTALETARQAARAAGLLVAERGAETGAVRLKGRSTDMVTDTDVLAGIAVVHEIVARDPGASFVIEEDEVHDRTGAPRGAVDDDEVWVVDPLDGTTSFVHGFPCYSVSVALLRAGTPVVGAVYNIPAQELFSACQGAGAYLNEMPIACGSRVDLAESLMITGFPYDRTTTLDQQLEVLARFLRAPVHGVRRDGSAAVDCCHVACGRADGFWEFGLQPWDSAAGVIILRESGAEVTDIDAAPWTPASTGIIAANPALHAEMASVILQS